MKSSPILLLLILAFSSASAFAFLPAASASPAPQVPAQNIAVPKSAPSTPSIDFAKVQSPAPNWKPFSSCLLAAKCLSVTAPQSLFQGAPSATNVTVHYVFTSIGIPFWYNSLGGNFSVAVLKAQYNSLSSPVLLVPTGVSVLNSTTVVETYHPFGYPSDTITAYFTQQVSNGYVSLSLKNVIAGTLPSAGKVCMTFISPSSQPISQPDSYSVSSQGEGYDWHDSAALGPAYSSGTVCWSVGASFTIDPATIATSTITGATANTFSTKLVTCNGQHLAFFSDGTNIVYYSSPDMATWTSQGTVTSSSKSSQGIGFSVAVSGTSIVYSIVANDGTSAFHYRDGVCGSNGVITWNRAEQSVTTTGSAQGVGSTAYDGTNIGVAALTASGGVYDVEVWEGTGGGTFTRQDLLTLTSSVSGAGAILLASSSGPILVVPSTTGASYETLNAQSAAWGSSTWTNLGTTTNSYGIVDSACSASGTKAYCSGITNYSGNTIGFFHATFGTTSSVTDSLTPINSYQDASIATDGTTISIVYGQTATVSYIVSTNLGSTWSGSVTVSSSETGFVDTALNCDPALASYKVQCIWTAGTASPYDVRGAAISLTVTLPFVCTTANSGGSFTVTLLGGSVSPTSATCSSAGTTTNLTTSPSATITATVAADGANTRQRWSGESTTTSTTSCASGTCSNWSVTLYYELKNTFQVSANAQSNFDTGMSWAVTGEQSGTAGATIATISSTAASSDSASGWGDYNTATSIPQAASSPPANSRWYSSAPCPNTPTTGGNTYNCNSYKQWSNTFDYSVTGGGTPTAPTLTCTQYGSAASCGTLTTSPVAYYVDNGGTATATDPAGGSTSTERWSSNAQSFTITAGGGADVFAYYHQYLQTVSYSGTVAAAPSISSTAFGGATTLTLPSVSPQTVWLDNGAAYTIPKPASNFPSTIERYETNAPNGTVSSAATIAPAFYHQYQVDVTASSFQTATGLTLNTQPSFTITCQAFGAGSTITVLNSNSFEDAGQACSQTSVTWRGIAVAGAAATVSSSGALTFSTLVQNDASNQFQFAIGSAALSSVSWDSTSVQLSFSATGTGTQTLELEEISNTYKVAPGYITIDGTKYTGSSSGWGYSSPLFSFSGIAVGTNAVVVSWAGQVGPTSPPPTTGGTGSSSSGTGTTYEPPFYLSMTVANVTIPAGASQTVSLPVKWTGTSQITITEVDFTGPEAAWFSLLTQVPQPVYALSFGQTNTTVQVTLSVPASVAPGVYQVPITVSARSQAGSVSNLQQTVDVVVTPGSSPGQLSQSLPDTFLILVFAGTVLIAFSGAFRRRK